MEFLQHPPLSLGQLLGYRLLLHAAVATIPVRLRRMLGVRRLPGAILLGRGTIAVLRWALGSSPTWNLALVRVDAPIPAGYFRQPLPAAAIIPPG